MTGNPAGNRFCPVCDQPISWFGDHWKCAKIKVHDHAANAAAKASWGW